ncbi:hypothetical protein HK098_004188 [Nowakowskiella sp. JEL0407]|nr:hypothetical protein HK098_004188 [Nowakowskiella sp. JEL0407]
MPAQHIPQSLLPGQLQSQQLMSSLLPQQLLPQSAQIAPAGLNPQLPSSQPPIPRDPYSLLSLISLIRPSDSAKNLLASGADLTTLGLNLNSTDTLNSHFVSPFADDPLLPHWKNPKFELPDCYNIQDTESTTNSSSGVPTAPPILSKVNSFSDETLFYIFYTLPREAVQEAAAQELYNRNWRFHKDMKIWITKEQNEEVVVKGVGYERGIYVLFDVVGWQKVKKELILYYEQLEERGVAGAVNQDSGSSVNSRPPQNPIGTVQQPQQSSAATSQTLSSQQLQSQYGFSDRDGTSLLAQNYISQQQQSNADQIQVSRGGVQVPGLWGVNGISSSSAYYNSIPPQQQQQPIVGGLNQAALNWGR